MQKLLIALCLFFGLAFATLGVDISAAASESTMSCLSGKGYDFVVVRCYRSTGSVDPNCASSVANAHSGGMSGVDIYLFPCYSCGNGGSQVNTLIQYTQSNGVKFGTLWLDIEQANLWGSTSDNQAFFESMVSAAKSNGVSLGVYTSSSQWAPIMGSSYDGGSSYPLWYAHYDNNPSFSDFSPFGGWSSPAYKQYNGDSTVCGLGVDLDYTDGSSSSNTAGHNTATNSHTNNNNNNNNNAHTNTGYTSNSDGSSSSSGGFEDSEKSLYSSKPSGGQKIEVRHGKTAEVDETVTKGEHVQVAEEKGFKKFL